MMLLSFLASGERTLLTLQLRRQRGVLHLTEIHRSQVSARNKSGTTTYLPSRSDEISFNAGLKTYMILFLRPGTRT
jgi:hypothetical protein